MLRSGRTYDGWAAGKVVVVRVKAKIADLLRSSTNAELDSSLAEARAEVEEIDDVELLPDGTFSTERTSILAKPLGGTKRPNQHRHDKRAAKRKASKESRPSETPVNVLPRLLASVDKVAVDFAATKFPYSANAYTAKHSKLLAARQGFSAEDMHNLGFIRIAYEAGRIRLVVDEDDRIIACFVGHPRDKDWGAVCLDAFDAFVAEADEAKLRTNPHTRGRHVAVNAGIMLPPGAQEPVNVRLGPCGKIIQRLVGRESVRRMALFQSAAFDLWAPRLHEHFHKQMASVMLKRPDLQRNWVGSIFPMACFNLSSHVVCFKHRDVMNVPYGWCAITALGRFDHTRSACLVLWELRLFFEFPHGCTVYVPSASITHSNTTIVNPSTEKRASFTQYFPGFLM